MAETSGMAEIRGIDIDKVAKGFADEENIFKSFVSVMPTSAREIRWYQKTAGFLAAVKPDSIDNVSQLALPTVVEQSWTRQQSYVRKYFVESPLISQEDIKDTDIDILMTNIRDLTRAVARLVDERIYNVITENQSPSNILSGAATGTGWDDTTTGNPILDIMAAKQAIRAQGYNPEGAVLVMNSIEHKWLLNYLITVKGSSIPNYSSDKVESGVVMNILGTKILVSENAPTDSVAMWIPGRSATWKTFVPITSRTIEDVGIGTKIRVWEEGECILTDPKSVYLITDTIT